MAGNASNVALWQGADVYLAPVGSAGPINCVQSIVAPWAPVGLLDGEAGLTHARDKDSQEYYSWGGVLVRRSDSKHKRTISFACLEDNATVFGLVNPGSDAPVTASGLTTATIKTPSYAEFAMVLELRDGYKVKRRIVKRAAVEEVGEVKESESDIVVYTVTVAILPETDGTIFTELSGVVGS